MADFNGVRMADIQASPPKPIDARFDGTLKIFAEKFAGVVGTHIAGSRVLVGRIQKGAIIHKIEFVGSVANTCTLDFGDGTTADIFVDGMAPANAEQVYVGANAVDIAAGVGIGEALAKEIDVHMTILTAALATGTYVIRTYFTVVG